MAHRLKSAGVRQYRDVVDREGRWTGKTAFNEAALTELLRRREPATIGLGFMGDMFHESVPDAWLDRMLAVVALTPHIRYILPTKRAKKMREYVHTLAEGRVEDVHDVATDIAHERFRETAYLQAQADRLIDKWPLPNLALMLSASNQAELDARAGDFLATPAALRVLSLEPMLGAVDLRLFPSARGLGWVIVGGESGPGARPMPPEWARSVRDQCIAAGVPYFHKQNGEWSTVALGPVTFHTPHENVPVGDGTHHRMFRVGKKAAGQLLDGRTWDEKPEGWG
jgi:protein gp37